MTEYRKRYGSDTWHWRTDCINYPQSDYRSSRGAPAFGELCNQCKARQKAGAGSRAASGSATPS